MTDEWAQVREALTEAGVVGVEDLGRFVNNTTYLRPSRLDERAAGPTFLRLLSLLQNPRVVAAVAGHLQRPWLRDLDGAYDIVRAAYLRAPESGDTGWHLGDTLCRAADKNRAADVVGLAGIAEHGKSRAWIVESLWRFKADADVEPLLRRLIADPDVTYMAMPSLQRTVGVTSIAPILEHLLETDIDPVVRHAAERQLRRVRRKAAQRT